MKTQKMIISKQYIKIPEDTAPVLYTECWCHSPYHSLRWHINSEAENDKPNITFDIYLNPYVSLWNRFKNAWNYIFNKRYVSCGYDTFTIKNEDIKKLKSLLEQVE